MGQNGKRRSLYWVADDSSDKDQLSCWGKHSRWKELMVTGAKFRRNSTSPRDWRSWDLRLIRREISEGRLGNAPFPATWARACGLQKGEATLVGAASWRGFHLWSLYKGSSKILAEDWREWIELGVGGKSPYCFIHSHRWQCWKGICIFKEIAS